MRKLVALFILLVAAGCIGGTAQAGGWRHGPPCPDTKYWHLSRKAYAQWTEFKLFDGSWGERHKVIRRPRGDGVVVKVWRPARLHTECS